MKGFEIYYSDKNISVENVKKAVKVEFEGTDALLGYRAIQKKLRQVGNIRVSRRDFFSSPLSNMVHSLEMYNKFYENKYPQNLLKILMIGKNK